TVTFAEVAAPPLGSEAGAAAREGGDLGRRRALVLRRLPAPLRPAAGLVGAAAEADVDVTVVALRVADDRVLVALAVRPGDHVGELFGGHPLPERGLEEEALQRRLEEDH